MTLRDVVMARISAAIRSPGSRGEEPTRTNGLSTGAATCQPADIWVAGAAPNARCLPNGGTAAPAGGTSEPFVLFGEAHAAGLFRGHPRCGHDQDARGRKSVVEGKSLD